MDELLNDKEQVEFVKGWLRENGPWLAAGVAIGAAALWGWNYYQSYKERVALEASTRYEQLIDAYGRNDRVRGLALADGLRRDYASSPYADQADLAVARAMVDGNDLPKAAERLTRVMNDSKDLQLRLVARLRLARVQLAQGQPDTALGTLSAAEAGAFAAKYAEARGDILFFKGDKAGALREYQTARANKIAGVVDAPVLELKIADLKARGIGLPSSAAPVSPVAPANKPR